MNCNLSQYFPRLRARSSIAFVTKPSTDRHAFIQETQSSACAIRSCVSTVFAFVNSVALVLTWIPVNIAAEGSNTISASCTFDASVQYLSSEEFCPPNGVAAFFCHCCNELDRIFANTAASEGNQKSFSFDERKPISRLKTFQISELLMSAWLLHTGALPDVNPLGWSR